MIFELYLGLLGLAFLFIFYGWYAKVDMPRIIGFLFIFLLGAMFTPSLPGNVEYKSGETHSVSGNVTTVTYDYSEAGNHTLGFYLSIAGILGVVLIMVDRRREEREN